MARITTTQANLRGPINRDENLIAHSWFLTLAIGATIGGIALLIWMFQAGAWSERQWPTRSVVPRPRLATSVAPPAINIHVDGGVRITPAVPMPAPSPVELTPEELDRRHSEYLRSRGQ